MPLSFETPHNCHPFIKRLYKTCYDEQISIADVADRAGVDAKMIRHWRTKNTATITNLQAVLNVVGLELYIRRIREPDD